MLLGISEESKAYRLYNPIIQKIIISHDVIFDENSCWDGSREGNITFSVDLDANDESKTEIQSSKDSLSNVPLHEQIETEPLRLDA